MSKLVNRQKKMSDKERQYILTRLYEGGNVWFDNHTIRAVEYYGGDIPCYECSMDCICSDAMNELCAELSVKYHKTYMLKLVLRR